MAGLSADRSTPDPGTDGPSGGVSGGGPSRVLVIDDDPSIHRLLADYLPQHNIRIVAVLQRREVARQFSAAEPDVVLLDLQLGTDDGLDVLREIRSHSDVPIIIITGHRCNEVNRVVGLELGADDYIIKPFGPRELLARIRAVLRRQRLARLAWQRTSERGRVRFDGWELNRHTCRLSNPNNAPVALTKREYALLVAFLNAPQRPLSREHLLQATRIHDDVCDRSIDVQILRLRRKLEADPRAPRIIRTERGIGYFFAPPVDYADPAEGRSAIGHRQ
jgi:two-component system, OmpR family, response regulator